MTELELLRGDIVVRVIPVDEGAVTLGRDLGNRVVLVDESVSAHHAVVQRGPDGVTVRDLGSTNGTFVNDVQVEGSARMAHGDVLRLGPDLRLRVRSTAPQPGGVLVLRDLSAGTVHLLEDDRFVIGSGEGAGVRLAEGPERAATLVVHPDGETWLGTAEGDRPLQLGETFEVAGCAFRVELLAQDTTVIPTVRPHRTALYPYVLTITLDAAAGSLAVLTQRDNDRVCRIDADQRVVLLWMLATRRRDDRAARVVPALAGWCHDEDLMVGIWGREVLHGAPSRYSVLLHRVRKDLESAGFDPWCLEKRRGATRLLIDDLRLS